MRRSFEKAIKRKGLYSKRREKPGGQQSGVHSQGSALEQPKLKGSALSAAGSENTYLGSSGSITKPNTGVKQTEFGSSVTTHKEATTERMFKNEDKGFSEPPGNHDASSSFRSAKETGESHEIIDEAEDELADKATKVKITHKFLK